MKEHDEKERAPEEELAVDFEPEDELGSAGAQQAKLKKLRAELEKAKAERQEYLDGWQRAKADAVNSRKDALKEAERSTERTVAALFDELIPVVDSFDMATGSELWASVESGFRTGMENVRNQLLDVLSRHGVTRYGKVGDPFSPHLHEAAEERDDVAGESGTIARILRYGYKSGDKIIRPAQVIIKK